jgi:hypothetical protein
VGDLDAAVSDAAINIDAPVDAAPPVPAPTGVVASDGTEEAHVAISWNLVSGATAYDVYRDGTLFAADITTTNHNDTGATAAAAPAAPTALAATDGTRTTDVQLTWAAAVAPVGASHSYTVRAKSPIGTSVDSGADTGYRGAYAVTGYDVYRDNTLVVADVATSNHDETTAASAGVPAAPTALAATDGTRTTEVPLTWDAAIAHMGPTNSYTVREKTTTATSVD